VGMPVCELFDMFVGTSTGKPDLSTKRLNLIILLSHCFVLIGGLISLGLAVCKLSAADVANLYNYERANRIMNKSAHDNAVGLLQTHPKYSGRGMLKVLKLKTHHLRK